MSDSEELDVLSITTTVGSMETARALATGIVENRLGACVQIDFGVTSFYRWKGELSEDAEARLVIKTVPECEAPLHAFFAEHHPYELPQFLVTYMRASPAYAGWVRAEVAAGPG